MKPPPHDPTQSNQTEADDDGAGVVIAMLDELPPICLAELEHGLSLLLKVELTSAERHVRDLGFLAEILDTTPKHRCGYPVVERKRYDQLRSQRRPDAPASERLVDRYGNGLWRMVCRKAHGLLPDGRYAGISNPVPSFDSSDIDPYVRAEVWAAINRCALEIGRVPSSHDFKQWAMATRRRWRELGPQPKRGSVVAAGRVPVIEILYRLYPALPGDRRGDRWARALRDARVSEARIAAARVARLLGRDGTHPASRTPAEAFDGTPLETLAEIGIDEETAAQIAEWGFYWLPLPAAALLANTLGGSLEWLGGFDADPGAPAPPHVAFDLEALPAHAKRARKTMKQLRLSARMDAANWLKLLGGKREPTLAELFALARTLSVAVGELTRAED